MKSYGFATFRTYRMMLCHDLKLATGHIGYGAFWVGLLCKPKGSHCL